NNYDTYSDCYLVDSKVKGNIVPSMGKHPEMNVNTSIKLGPFEYIHAHCYNHYGSCCFSEFGWCHCEW
ncbi:hypothetical protein PIROE2DRAFT_12646, partial [Piromyces sp. E2]